ncbi:hypothetical protein [Adlercreutzia shanghongiae]|uniref:DUF3168 domain-containing protein n=1 Tax=Adlercreutzia shanghongiae TaxID=3111773 RepID=A0ABU6IWD2_9ACTN|nr:hypothetical protein [Adlercreutzia sp. R22]MEC4294043.1 hypothetical protein [Adlercreutzia sp. R22]
MVGQKSILMPAREAKEAIGARMRAVFAPEVFGALYPDVQPPRTYEGFPTNEPPFYVAWDEIVDAGSVAGAVTMGHPDVEFTLHVWTFAQHVDKKTASDTALAYTDVVLAALVADQTLNRTVDTAVPSITSAGTAADSSKRYMASVEVSVRCSVASSCPAEIKEAVDAANRGM